MHNPKYTKTYAEKIMMLKEGQVSPNHFHWHKMEDIINRGGGNLVFRLWNADKNEEVDRETPVRIFSDGREYTVPCGSEIILEPGQSLSLYPYYYHEFTIQPGTGYAIIGEDSTVSSNAKIGDDPEFYDRKDWGIAVVGKDKVVEKNQILLPKQVL